ncbi:uncharacterized protein LOC106142244 isoform X2 [Amyelois transitella]|uniref:uncharacterized protein LOC106142244 isoform X2 n=1 Tax=Amyelois transitella TaxID=680683 RepID=UPI00067BF7A8|nr:uncharacterized protein LOC106142244 isoform X2 [Amyelois transitella]
MFESDDYDQILSQFDFPNLPVVDQKGIESGIENSENVHTNVKENLNKNNNITNKVDNKSNSTFIPALTEGTQSTKKCFNTSSPILQLKECSTNISESIRMPDDLKVSPKHSKRKIIDSHFDYNSKRKFPGPAGLLTGSLRESKDETVCQLELFSQDVDFSQNSIKRGCFESPLWSKLKEDIVAWNLIEIDSIKGIKQQALAGNLRRRKAQTVTAFIETVDRSATDPLIVLRDPTGNIKCTLHRDAWSLFSSYLVADQCALVLWRPTVLTTGSAFKKHYLNITLSNIYAIFSSAILYDESESMPDRYLKECENDFTIIRIKEAPECLGVDVTAKSDSTSNEHLLDDLDSIFSDDLF